MTRKTKTQPYALTVDALSVDAQAIKRSADALRAADEDVSRCEQAHAKAQADVRDTRAALRTGSLAADGDDLHKAEAREAGTTLALEGARARASQLRARREVTSLDLLRAVEPALASLEGDGITVVYSLQSAPQELPDSLSLPVLWVSQRSAHERTKRSVGRGVLDDGSLTGQVQVTYYKTLAHKPLSPEHLGRLLAREDIDASVHGGLSTDTRDDATLDLHRAIPPLPSLLRTPQAGDHFHAGQGLVHEVKHHITQGDRYGTHFSVSSGVSEDAVRVEPGTDRVTKVQSEGGKRYTTVTCEHVITSVHGYLAQLAQRLPEGASILEGRTTSLGRCTQATMTVDVGDLTGSTVVATLTMVCVSQSED